MLVHTKLKSSTHRNQESDHLPAWCLIYWSPLGWKAEWQTITDWTRVFLKTRCFLQFQPLNLTACSQRRTWSWFIYSTSTGFTTGGRLTLSENTSKRCKWKKQIFFTRKHPVSFYTQSCCVRMCVCRSTASGVCCFFFKDYRGVCIWVHIVLLSFYQPRTSSKHTIKLSDSRAESWAHW